jgi:tRNA G18 (ribose-2'-O)-methylase SpoU
VPEIIVIAYNIRSTHNVGSIFRTCEGFGVSRLILSGYTSYPAMENDPRLPHIRDKLTAQIHKTALDAENLVPFEYQETPDVTQLKTDGYTIVGLEQDMRSIPLSAYKPPEKIVLWLGEEVEGMTAAERDLCDILVDIPMHGQKESFNVSVACGIALYGLTVAEVNKDNA